MADNIDVTPGTGKTVAADDVSGVLHQRVKLSIGADGSAADALGGSGAVAAGVQRVTLASDDPAVTVLDAINTTLGTPMKSTGGTVGLVAGEAHIGEVSGRTVLATASFTRPADTTAYALGDLVANSTTAGSVVQMQFTVSRIAAGSGMIRRLRLRKTGTSISAAAFRLHLFNASVTTITNGDNGAFSVSNCANYMGKVDLTCDQVFTDGASGNAIPSVGSEINFALASGQVIYGLLEARGVYTPGSAEVFTLELEVLQN
jgi:hypothetical protein